MYCVLVRFAGWLLASFVRLLFRLVGWHFAIAPLLLLQTVPVGLAGWLVYTWCAGWLNLCWPVDLVWFV